MFKRLFWVTLGFGSGLGTSWYVIRSVKKTVRRTVTTYAPAELATRAGATAHDLRVSVRAAIAEGRVAMHEREAELRARVEAHRVGAAVHAEAADAAPTASPAADAASTTHAGDANGPATAGVVPDELAARRNRTVPRAAGHARSGR